MRKNNELGKTVLTVARHHEINPNQLLHWLKQRQDGGLSAG
ncbi:transposase [Alcaligenes faecalis]